MMENLKMTEVFPEAFQVEHNKSFEVQDATWYSYGEKYESDGEQDSAIEHAVLNYDRLTEENKALKADRDNAISKMSKSWQHNADDHPDLLSRFVDMANRQFDEKDALREALSNLHWQVTARASERHILEADEVEWAKQLLNKNKV